MYSVYQHWDPLQTCVVGRTYPPEFYSWITVPAVRKLFEQIAIETEEDFQSIIKKLESFNVKVLRPDLPEKTFIDGKFIKPPMTPRDTKIIIGNVYYDSELFDFKDFYDNVKDASWPDCNNIEEFQCLPFYIQDECKNLHNMHSYINNNNMYANINNCIRAHGNIIAKTKYSWINGAMISRIGKDLYFGTQDYNENQVELKNTVDRMFTETRNHIVNTGGHSDATYCPVTPGLIISLFDVPTYCDTFPDWEVVYLPGQSWNMVKEFLALKEKNKGRWWIPGFEHNQDVVDTVENWLSHWTGYVEETVFDVNMLIVDTKNVIVFNYNEQVFQALNRYGITAHIVPFRHRYFWDGGIHCVTLDLDRKGTMQNYFPKRP